MTYAVGRQMRFCRIFSLDSITELVFFLIENVLWEKEQVTRKPRFKIRKDLDRWIISFYIGVLTALIGCIISISIEEISDLKYSFLQKSNYSIENNPNCLIE